MQRPARTLLVVATVAGVTAGPVALAVLQASTARSAAAAAAAAADVDLIARGEGVGVLPESLREDLASVPGIRAAAPLLTLPVRLAGEPTRLYGSNLRLRELGGELGTAFDARLGRYESRPGLLFTGVFVGAHLAGRLGLAPGDHVPAAVGATTTEVAVLDVVDAPFNGGEFAFALLAYAQRLAGTPRRVDAVLLAFADGADAAGVAADVRAAVGPEATVERPADAAAVTTRTTRAVVRLLVFLAALVAAAGVFLVRAVVLMTVEDRRRDLAVQRALGAPAGAIVRRGLAEVVLAAGTGALAGAAAGVALGAAVVRRLPWQLAGDPAVVVAPAVPAPLVVAVGVAVVVVVTAAVVPVLRRVVRRDPATELRPAAAVTAPPGTAPTRPRLAAAGIGATAAGLLSAAGFGIPLESLPPGVVSALIIGGAVAVLHGLAGPATRLMRRVVPGRRGAAGLAAVRVVRARARPLAVAGVGLLGVTIVVAVSGITADVRREVERLAGAWRDADLVVAAGEVEEPLRGGGIPLDLADTLARLDGVITATTLRRIPARLAGLPIEVVGVAGGTAHPLFAGAGDAARRAVLAGRGAVVSAALADRAGLVAGGELTLPGPDGPHTLPVAAVVGAPSLHTGGTLLLSGDQAAAWFDHPSVEVVELTLAAGTDPWSVHAAASDLVAGVPGATVRTGDDVAEAGVAGAGLLTAGFAAAQLLVVLVTALALVNLLLIAVVEQSDELALLRALGAPGGALVRLVVAEAGAALAVGAAAGVTLGVALHRAADVTIGDLFALDVPFRLHAVELITGPAVAVVLLAAALAAPALAAGRRRAVAA